MIDFKKTVYCALIAVGAVGSKCLAEKLHVRCIGVDDSESELGAVTFLYVQLDGIGDGCGRLFLA